MGGKTTQSNWDVIQSSTSGLEDLSKGCVKKYLFNHLFCFIDFNNIVRVFYLIGPKNM